MSRKPLFLCIGKKLLICIKTIHFYRKKLFVLKYISLYRKTLFPCIEKKKQFLYIEKTISFYRK